jgi:hypothetical protein
MKYPLHASHPSIPGTPNVVRHNPSDMIEDMATDNPLWIDQLVNPKYARIARRLVTPKSKSASSSTTLSMSNFHFGPSKNYNNFNTFSPKKLVFQKKYFLPSYRPSNASSYYRSEGNNPRIRYLNACVRQGNNSYTYRSATDIDF